MLKRFAVIGIMMLICGCQMRPAEQAAPPQPVSVVTLECFVRLHNPDGSYYLTEQRHAISPAESYLRISGIEAGKSYEWLLAAEQFSSDQPQARIRCLPEDISPLDYCRLILASFRAAITVQDSASAGQPVRILGNWAFPAGGEGDISWYRTDSRSAAAQIVVMRKQNGTELSARSYGHNAEGGLQSPSKIEIFRTNGTPAGGQTLLLTLDYRH